MWGDWTLGKQACAIVRVAECVGELDQTFNCLPLWQDKGDYDSQVPVEYFCASTKLVSSVPTAVPCGWWSQVPLSQCFPSLFMRTSKALRLSRQLQNCYGPEERYVPSTNISLARMNHTGKRKEERIEILPAGKYQKNDFLYKTQNLPYSPKVLCIISLRDKMSFIHELLEP